MSDLLILGIDPGSRFTGMVLRRGDELLGWHLTVRNDTARLPDGHYLRRVLGNCRALIGTYEGVVVGVEGIEWWPRKGQPRNERGNYGTAMVLGAVLARWPDAVVVEPGRGVGNYHVQAYPAVIRPPVNGKGADKLNHVRAGWDHSFAAETLHRTRVSEVRR